MEPTEVDVDELIEFWTLLDEDRELLQQAGRFGLAPGPRGGVADRTGTESSHRKIVDA
jgi:hypothetical protein